MRAAILSAYGGTPAVGDWPEPEGGAEVLAAALNPVDLRLASGTFYGGRPDLPYVPGGEAIVRLPGGRAAYVARPAALAERIAVDPATAAPVPEGLDPALALACGVPGSTALAALERADLREGERVLVLGATGAVGAFAVQLARLLGAQVVGAARNASGEMIVLDAIEGAGPFDVVVDPLWGAPAEAAVRALGPHGRLVQLGQSAGAEATLASGDVRGRNLRILGLALVTYDPLRRRALFERVVTHAAAGELAYPAETYALDDVASAWERLASGSPGAKLVVTP